MLMILIIQTETMVHNGSKKLEMIEDSEIIQIVIKLYQTINLKSVMNTDLNLLNPRMHHLNNLMYEKMMSMMIYLITV